MSSLEGLFGKQKEKQKKKGKVSVNALGKKLEGKTKRQVNSFSFNSTDCLETLCPDKPSLYE